VNRVQLGYNWSHVFHRPEAGGAWAQKELSSEAESPEIQKNICATITALHFSGTIDAS
jgi:hypothetical protein